MQPATLEEVITTPQLAERTSRPPDFEIENRALISIAEVMARDPEHLVQKLAEVVLEACHAGSSGVSILEHHDRGDVFRWQGTAGMFADKLGGTMPRTASPCGTVLDRDSVLMFAHPERFFEAVRGIEPAVDEVLLAPFHVDGEAVGTLWAVAHPGDRQFDSEDARVLTSLSQLASAGYQLYDSLQTAKRASQVKSQFLATMSHELRTPLTGVIGFSNLLETDVVGSTSVPQKEILSRIQASSWHLVGIIDEILTFSRAEAGKLEVHATPTNVVEMTREVIRMVEPQAAERGIRISLDEWGDRMELSTDRGKLRQIVLNLIGNAVKYTHQGSITVAVDTRDPEWSSISVQDTGPGIPAEMQEIIFEPFTQVDSSHTRSTGGAGLGLAISRRLSRLLGGDVTLESSLDAGSTFTLRLPSPGPTTGDRDAVS